jgi:LysM repeat protein
MKTLRLFLLLAFITGWFFAAPYQSVNAQTDPFDLVNAVNELRSSQGLSAYLVDGSLMASAQAQSDYMASLGEWTHARPDGSNPWEYGIQENVAMGGQMDAWTAVNVVWTDAIHWPVMVGNVGGSIGAGVASDGTNYYLTINVLPSGGSIQASSGVSMAAVEPVAFLQQANTPEPIYYGVAVSTPNADGSIYHTVAYGDTLEGISTAYGVPATTIQTQSGNSPDATELYVGNILVIHFPNTPTPTNQFPPTPTRLTPTPTLPRPTRTPMPTRTPLPTLTPTATVPAYYAVVGDSQRVGLVMAGSSLVGLILVVVFGFIKRPKS